MATKDHVANTAELEAQLAAAQKRLIFAQKEVSHLQVVFDRHDTAFLCILMWTTS